MASLTLNSQVRGNEAVAWLLVPRPGQPTLRVTARIPLDELRPLLREVARRRVAVGALLPQDEVAFLGSLTKAAKKLAKKLAKSKLAKGAWSAIKTAGPFLPSPLNQGIAAVDTAARIAKAATKGGPVGQKAAAFVRKAKQAKSQAKVVRTQAPSGEPVRLLKPPVPKGMSPTGQKVFRALVTLV